MVTFTAGADVWRRIYDSYGLDEFAAGEARRYLEQTLQNARLAHELLSESGELSATGIAMVDATLARAESSAL